MTRVSSDRESPYYSPFAQVSLDGRIQMLALEADSDEGWVDVVIGRNADGSFSRWRLRGDVVIQLAEDCP